jgi:hypothetical protein
MIVVNCFWHAAFYFKFSFYLCGCKDSANRTQNKEIFSFFAEMPPILADLYWQR